MKLLFIFLATTFLMFGQSAYIRNAYPDGLKVNAGGSADMYLQDQAGDQFIQYFAKFNDTLRVLENDAVLGSYDIVVKNSTLIATDIINITIDGQYYNGTILSVDDDTLTMDVPVNFAYDSGSVVREYTPEMNINASSPVIYTIINRTADPIDINKIAFYLTDDAEMDDAKFGAVNALSKGVTIRIKRSSGNYELISTVKNNAELAMISDNFDYRDTTSTGNYGLIATVRFNGQEQSGVAIRLELNEELQLIIKDNISGLTSFKCLAFGHFAED